MKVTRAHLEFWKAKKAPAPGWARPIMDRTATRPSVHELINLQVRTRDARETHYDNTVAILQRQRDRGELLHSLRKMAASPGCSFRPERRAANCKKWLARIAHC